MEGFSSLTLLWLAFAAFTAGLIDAVAGGGGLIQIPALMTALPDASPGILFGTNKGASIWGSASAAVRYARRVAIPWRSIALPASGAALLAAFCGAAAVSVIPKSLFRPLVFSLLLAVWLYTLAKPAFGQQSGHLQVGSMAQRLRAISIGACIGFYDGFFGPGTGSFLIFAFIRFLRLDFLHASACAKVVNVATNFAALSFFLPSGQILLPVAGLMALCNVAGAQVGSRLALRLGPAFVRVVFLLVTGSLMIKLGWDLFAK